ncbi:MAG: alpha-hydroxy acid oxidase [Pseudomonadota bacterium]
MDLHAAYPALSDVKARAKRRIPHFVWEYLDSATGNERTLERNRTALDRVLFEPAVLRGPVTPDLSRRLMGRDYAVPFGISPVGMSGLIWPDAERLLARYAASVGMPYGMSTVASQTPEYVGPCAGDQGWFQLYPPAEPEIRDDMLRRAKDAGFHTLILTVDVPGPSRRERQTRGGLVQPPVLRGRMIAQAAMCPAWSLGVLKHGMPRLRFIDSYMKPGGLLPSNAHAGYLLRTSPDWEYLKALRDAWDGPLVVKGILRAEDAARMEGAGVDAVWVSNHAGRQFDAAPATIEALPAVREATKLPVIFDSGIEGGLDVMRALAMGADFVMLGRAWHYGLAAFGPKGLTHVKEILEQDLIANMVQIGANDLAALRNTAFVVR